MTTATAPSCTSCPLYVKTAEAKDCTGRPYFGMCGASGRFINAEAALRLPGTPACPATLGTDYSPTHAADLRSKISLTIDAHTAFRPDGSSIPTDDTEHVYGEPITEAEAASIARDAGGSGTPDSCKRCVFFTDKTHGAKVAPGTPAARYDYCARKGTLIEPGTRGMTAASCTVGVKGAPSVPDDAIRLPLYVAEPSKATTTGGSKPMTAPTIDAPTEADYVDAAVEGATAADLTDLARRIMEAAAPTTAEGRADAAAEASAAVMAALAKGGGVTADVPTPEPTPATPAVPAPRPVPTAFGSKPMPKRPKTGMIFPATDYDLTEPLAAWRIPALPEGAYGVVAIRSTSKASAVVYLPVYDEASFPESVRHDVPSADGIYLDHSDLLFRMAVAYATDSVCALWGDAGVGKTEGVEHLARLTRQPFRRISIKWATQVDDLMGRWTLRDGTMEWLDGRFVKAWRGPYVVCVDEPNTGKDEVWQALRAPFDGARLLVLDEKDGEQVPRHPGCRVFTAMNPSWDARFTGTQPLNDADLDRMQHITVPYPSEDVEKEILTLKCEWLSDEQKVAMLKVARDIRSAVTAQTIRVSFGVRKMLRWADTMRYLDPLTAFRQAVSNHMHPDEARTLNDIADAYFR